MCLPEAILINSTGYSVHSFSTLYIGILEESLASLKVGLERGDKQRLAEPTGADQEDILAKSKHLPDILRLVDI